MSISCFFIQSFTVEKFTSCSLDYFPKRFHIQSHHHKLPGLSIKEDESWQELWICPGARPPQTHAASLWMESEMDSVQKTRLNISRRDALPKGKTGAAHARSHRLGTSCLLTFLLMNFTQ